MGSPILIWVILPLADLRSVLEPANELIDGPWTATSQNKFLRRFGALRYSKDDGGSGAVPAWLRATEGWYIAAGRFARILPKAPADATADVGQGCGVVQAIGCRLFADAVLNARLEIVLRVTTPDDVEIDMTKLLKAVAELDVEVRQSRPGKRAPARTTVKLAGLGGYFQRAYALARLSGSTSSTARTQLDAATKAGPNPLRLVKRLDPLLVVYQLAPAATPFTQIRWLAPVVTGKANFRALSVQPGSADVDTAPVRAIRRTFVRLHCMTEAMERLVGALPDGDGSIDLAKLRRLEALVQQAEAGSNALRARPEQPFAALDVAAERFATAANALGDSLGQYAGTPASRILRDVQQRWAAGAPLLPEADRALIEEILLASAPGRQSAYRDFANGLARQGADPITQPQKVLFGDDFLSPGFITGALQTMLAVARLVIPRFENGQPQRSGSSDKPLFGGGTGWIIGPQHVITNWHVIAARGQGSMDPLPADIELQCAATTVEFDFDDDNLPAGETAGIAALVHADPVLDYAVLRLALPTARQPLRLRNGALALDTEQPFAVNIVQHPNGLAKQLGLRNNFVVALEGNDIAYSTATDFGSSGSPVCDDAWRVVALHKETTDKFGAFEIEGKSTASINVGTPIHLIIDDLRKHAADAWAAIGATLV